MGRRIVAVMAAVVVALIGVVAVLFYAKGADSRAVADQQPKTVYIAQKLVPSGTSAADAVAQGMIVPTQVAAKGLPPGAMSTVDETNGKLLALTDIAVGEFVVAGRFGSTPTGERAIQVPVGQVALSVSLADPARVGQFVTPGSHIIIYDTYGANEGKRTQVLLDDVLVIAIGSTSLTPVGNSEAQAAAAANGGALVTVSLPPATATKLVHAIQTGVLYVGLRGTDTKAVVGQVVSDATLFTK